MVSRIFPATDDENKLKPRCDAHASIVVVAPTRYDFSSIDVDASLDMLHTIELFGDFITSDSTIFPYIVKVFIDTRRLQDTQSWTDQDVCHNL